MPSLHIVFRFADTLLEILRGREKYPGPDIARAWFRSVINPRLSTLRNEREYLVNKKWTYRIYESSLSQLSFIKDSPFQVSDYQNSDNQVQFLESYPEINQVVEEHDREVRYVRELVLVLHHVLEKSEPLCELYQETVSHQSLQKLRKAYPAKLAQRGSEDSHVLDVLFGTMMESERLALLAQHIVNTESDLFESHNIAPLWNTYKSQFLEILDHPSIREHTYRAILARESLLEIIGKLIDLLEKTRYQLAREYRIPYAPVHQTGGIW